MNGFNDNTGNVDMRSTHGHVDSPTRSKRDALDEAMWSFHDRHHTGPYVECSDCTQIWAFFNEHPRFNVL